MNRIWLGIGILTLGGVAAAQVQREPQPSLGTVAKTTKEAKAKAAATPPENKPSPKTGGATKATPDQKSGTTTAKKYTNEDLYVRPRPAAVTSSATPSPTSSATAYRTRTATGAASNSGDRGKDEAYWRSRAEPVRRTLQEYTDRLQAAKKQQEAVKAKQGLDVSVANGQASANTYEVQRLANQVMELEAQVRRYEGAMKSLEDEGRRAGALPGWFR